MENLVDEHTTDIGTRRQLEPISEFDIGDIANPYLSAWKEDCRFVSEDPLQLGDRIPYRDSCHPLLTMEEFNDQDAFRRDRQVWTISKVRGLCGGCIVKECN